MSFLVISEKGEEGQRSGRGSGKNGRGRSNGGGGGRPARGRVGHGEGATERNGRAGSEGSSVPFPCLRCKHGTVGTGMPRLFTCAPTLQFPELETRTTILSRIPRLDVIAIRIKRPGRTPPISPPRCTMHNQSNLNTSTAHPDPSLLGQGYTFFPNTPGSNFQMSNMRGVNFGPNTSVISGSWGSYVRMDIRLRGSTAHMDGRDQVNHERREPLP